MSNLQTFVGTRSAVASNSGVLATPDSAWWDLFVAFTASSFDSYAALSGVLQRALPPWLVRADAADTPPCGSRHYFHTLFSSRAFWEGLHRAGNRGRFLFEFDSEYPVSHAGFEYALPKNCGSLYLLHIDLRPGRFEEVSAHYVYDDPLFYETADRAHDEWREEECYGDDDDDYDDGFEAHEQFAGRYFMLERFDNVWDYVDSTSRREPVSLSPSEDPLLSVGSDDVKYGRGALRVVRDGADLFELALFTSEYVTNRSREVGGPLGTPLACDAFDADPEPLTVALMERSYTIQVPKVELVFPFVWAHEQLSEDLGRWAASLSSTHPQLVCVVEAWKDLYEDAPAPSDVVYSTRWRGGEEA